MKYTLKRNDPKPFLCSKNNILIEVNNEFESLTGYARELLLGKSLKEISEMLRIDSQVYLQDIEKDCSCYMFTKENEPREVTIFCRSLECENEKSYFMIEKRNSRIEDTLPFISGVLADGDNGVAIYSSDDLILLKANEKLFNFRNMPFSKIGNYIGKNLEQTLSVYEEGPIKEAFTNVIKTGKSYHLREGKYKHPEKGDTYWNVSLAPIYISGKAKYIIQTTYDLEEIVFNKMLFEKQRQELEAIIENMSDELIIVDKYGQYTKVNRAFRNSSLYSDKGIANADGIFKQAQHFDIDGNLIPLEDFPSKRIIKGEKFSGYRMDIKNNRGIVHREISGTPIYDSYGNFLVGVLVNRDIAERLNKQENLMIKTQYDLISSVISNLDLGIIRVSYPDLTIIDINNKAYKELLHTNSNIDPSAPIIGKNIHDIKSNDEIVEFNKDIENLIKKKDSINVKIKNYNILGEEKFVKIIVQPLFGINNNVVELTQIAIDITDEIKAKNKMEEALKMQEELFVNISHELKTPLNVIFSTNQLMDFYMKNDLLEVNKNKVSRNINSIKQNCYRSIKLINNIVDISRIESGFFKLNLTNENIVQVIEDIVQSVAEYTNEKKLKIVFDTDTEEKMIACDSEKIERIILNLISNAIKFSNQDGLIFINIFDKDDTVEIDVKDTGIGIDKKHQDDIFKRFYQVDKSLSRNAEGTGIGLSLIKSIVEMHGGKISVESELGEGSIFKIELPSRTVEEYENMDKNNSVQNKVEMIDIEFSDIYPS